MFDHEIGCLVCIEPGIKDNVLWSEGKLGCARCEKRTNVESHACAQDGWEYVMKP